MRYRNALTVPRTPTHSATKGAGLKMESGFNAENFGFYWKKSISQQGKGNPSSIRIIQEESPMSMDLAKSETHQNLLRAFAGESQARNRYTFAADLARQQNLQVIEGVFRFTADQERAHAKVFYSFLEPLCGKNIAIDGTYPVDLSPSLLDQLRAAQHNEYQEWEHDYAAFAKVAEKEGFLQISKAFELIAGVEKTHGDRFGRFADLLENDGLFQDQGGTKWMCLNCGQIVDTSMAPALCPICKYPQGYFIRLDMAPFGA